jgi:AcrR family transcriptional regulator
MTAKRKRRGYVSPLRTEHVARTRERILEGLMAELRDGGVREVTLPLVARRARVGVQTVYRHFPSKQALLDAFMDVAARRLPKFAGAGADGLAAGAPDVFAAFDAEEALCRAFVTSRLGRELRAVGRRERLRQFERALQPVTARLDAAAARRVSAFLKSIYSVSFWMELKDAGGFDGRAAGETVGWVMRVLLAELRRDPCTMERA